MNKNKGILLTMLSSLIFGFAFTLAPMTYGAAGGNAVTLSFLRNFLCLPFLLAALLVTRTPLRVTRRQLGHFALMGLLGSATYTLLLNDSFSYIDVGVSTTVTFVYPVFVALGCALFFRERMGPRKLTALCIAMGGIVCFFIAARATAAVGQNSGLGMVLTLSSAVFYSFYLIYMDKSGMKAEPPLKVTFYVALFAAAGIALFGALSGRLVFRAMTGRAWFISVVFALLCTVVGLPLMQLGIKHIGATAAALVTMLEPITSVVFGALLLHEKVTPLKVAACALILLGVLLLSLPQKKGVPAPEQ